MAETGKQTAAGARPSPERLFKRVGGDVFAVFERWARRDAEYFERAQNEFERAVQPVAYHVICPTADEIDQMNIAFTEWFLFEFAVRDGMSPLRHFVQDMAERDSQGSGHRAHAARLARLVQVADTQRFSRFQIAEKYPEERELVLVDIRTAERARVYDPVSSRRNTWRDGTLALRIARVDGRWLSVGKTALYDRESYELLSGEGPGERGEDSALPSSGSYFLDVLRDVAGVDSPISHTLRVVKAR